MVWKNNHNLTNLNKPLYGRVVILPKASTSRISELSTFHRNTVNLTPEPIIKQVIWSNFNLKKQIQSPNFADFCEKLPFNGHFTQKYGSYGTMAQHQLENIQISRILYSKIDISIKTFRRFYKTLPRAVLARSRRITTLSTCQLILTKYNPCCRVVILRERASARAPLAEGFYKICGRF